MGIKKIKKNKKINLIPWKDLKKIAYIRRNNLGDLCMAMPGLILIKELAPQAEIVLYGSKSNQLLAPYFSEYFKDFKVIEAPYGRNFNILKNFLSPRKYDLVISAKTSPDWQNSLLLKSFKARFTLGFGLNKALDKDPDISALHQSAKILYLISGYLNFQGQINKTPENLYPKIKINISQELINHWSEAYLINLNQPKLLVSLSNNRASCRLNFEYLIKLLTSFKNKYFDFNYQIIFTALPQDQEFAQKLVSLISGSVFIPTPNFHDFMQLLYLCDLGLCGDSGTGHLLAAMGKPQVLLLDSEKKLKHWGVLNTRAICLVAPEEGQSGDVNKIPMEKILGALEDSIKNLS